MARRTTPDYAAIARSFDLAEKILKYSYNKAGKAQNKPDDLMILSALVRLKKRLDDLSKKTRSGKIISKAIKRCNRKAPPSKASTTAEIAEKCEDACERDYNEACSIFNEAADAGTKLPSVPAVDGIRWGFMVLHNWCNESLRKISSKLRSHIRKITSGKAGDTSQATPETDSKLIYQAGASQFYNIPKATLSKAANKKAGELGYLWSGRRGNRVFYRKADIEKLSRSRAKLSR